MSKQATKKIHPQDSGIVSADVTLQPCHKPIMILLSVVAMEFLRKTKFYVGLYDQFWVLFKAYLFSACHSALSTGFSCLHLNLYYVLDWILYHTAGFLWPSAHFNIKQQHTLQSGTPCSSLFIG